MDDLIYWIWLSLACTPDTATFIKLIKQFGDPIEIYNATERQIRSCVGPNVSDCTALINKDLDRAREVFDFCRSKGVGIITYSDDTFPESLRDIPTPPVLLYYRGKLPTFKKDFRCAIVGTRSLSDYGRKNAYIMGYDLGCVGATIVSGMAKGIDGVAMAGAIAAGAPTIAVLGSGIDVCYPSEHLKLAREIVKNGCIFTEYAPGTKPEKMNFPRRNRLISGLAAVTVIVEGKESSGAMITARHAKAQGRTVYAFPGNVGNDGSQSTNLLIKNGAKLCTASTDIIDDYEKIYLGIINPFLLKEKAPKSTDMMNVLRELQVAAVTPTDDIFIYPKIPRQMKSKENVSHSANAVAGNVTESAQSLPEMPEFDASLLSLYKKIPTDEDCSIEELTDENNDMRSVMKMLLKLEMGQFIVLLPGDRVRRKFRFS